MEDKDIVLKYLGGKYFEVAEEIKYTLSDGDVITIPVGFKTDLSSSPRFLWGLFPPYGNFLLASLVHDYLYVTKAKSLPFADKEMLLISNRVNKNKVDNYIRFAYVRAFGWVWYYGYRQKIKEWLSR